MSSKIMRVLMVAALVLLVFSVVTAAYAQGTTGTATPTGSTSGGSAGTTAGATATPRTLPSTGGDTTSTSTATIVLLALGATAGLGGLLLRGLRQPR